MILDEKTNENHFKDFELNFVELPKFTKTLEELKDIKDKWIYFVKNAGTRKMFDDGLPIETISKYTGLTLKEIENLTWAGQAGTKRNIKYPIMNTQCRRKTVLQTLSFINRR